MARENTRRLLLLALAAASWLASFILLVSLGTWAGFALAGTVLTALSLRLDHELRALLRPSLPKVAVGLLLGGAMVLLTHAAYAVVTVPFREIETATLGLYTLLNGSGFTPVAQAAFVVVLATCEEILFRGGLLGSGQGTGRGFLRDVMSWRGLRPVVLLAACYAGATLPLGSLLLAVCAFLCGIAWGALRVVTRSLVSPIVAHVVWDLAIFLAWPLV